MVHHVSILHNLATTLSTHTQPGVLVGLVLPNKSILIDVIHSLSAGCSQNSEVPDAGPLSLIPHGLTVLGRFCPTSDNTSAARPPDHVLQHPAVIVSRASSGSLTYQHQKHAGAPMQDLEVSCLPPSNEPLSCLQDNCRLVRCSWIFTLRVYHVPSASFGTAVTLAFASINSELLAENLCLLLSNSTSTTVVTDSSTGTVADLCSSSSAVAQAQLMVNTTADIVSPAPSYQYQPAAAGPVNSESVTMCADVLCYVPTDTPVDSLSKRHVVPALQQQLQHMQQIIIQAGKVLQVRAHHFLPPGRNHHVTLLYPTLSANPETTELKLTPLRSLAHKWLGLPTNKPLLRLANALDFSAAHATISGTSMDGERQVAGGAKRLKDVHATLAAPGIGGSSSLVDGSYEYFHYMQDKVNDAGWGCAYRSLQTICSWFKLQHYTNKEPPTHRQIQETLVKLGDKPTHFVGSNQWIGAIELGYILDEYLGVTSKIITVNRGSDIPSKARELAAHFQSQGTPVMIGGGVLAYTLLGVQFNELTGEAAFLILDPHYTGGEELKKVQQGTWVAWKKLGDHAAAGGPLFVADAFYNFLCPQRPNTV